MKSVNLKNLIFEGIYARDTLPGSFSNNHCCIFNNHDSNTAGEHWLSLIKSNNKIYIYDSFGRPNDHFKLPREYKQSEKSPEQLITENNCGYRCIAYIIVFDRFGRDTALYI